MAKKVIKINPVKHQTVLKLQPKKRVCAYRRVSTDSREQQNSFSAQGEAENVSTDNKWANVKRFKDGTYITSCPAYGYTKDENGQLIIQEEEAHL